MAYVKDPSYYTDDFSKELLAEGARFAAENKVDPIALSPIYRLVDRALLLGEKAIFIGGDPGTAKTSTPRLHANKHGIPFLLVPCSAATRASTLIGKLVFNPHKGIDGDTAETVFREGPLLKGFAKECEGGGSNVCLDDFPQTNEEAQTAVQEFAMMPNIYYCPENGKIYHRHPNFRLIMTGNPGCRGNNKLTEALKSRILYFDIGKVDEKGMLLIGKSKSGKLPLSDKFFKDCFALCAAVSKFAQDNSKLHVACGIREIEKLLSFLKNDDGTAHMPSDDDFFGYVEVSLINILKQEIRPDLIDGFKRAPSTQAMMKSILDSYKACVNPGAAQAPQPEKNAKSKSGSDLFDDLMDERIHL